MDHKVGQEHSDPGGFDSARHSLVRWIEDEGMRPCHAKATGCVVCSFRQKVQRALRSGLISALGAKASTAMDNPAYSNMRLDPTLGEQWGTDWLSLQIRLMLLIDWLVVPPDPPHAAVD